MAGSASHDMHAPNLWKCNHGTLVACLRHPTAVNCASWGVSIVVTTQALVCLQAFYCTAVVVVNVRLNAGCTSPTRPAVQAMDFGASISALVKSASISNTPLTTVATTLLLNRGFDSRHQRDPKLESFAATVASRATLALSRHKHPAPIPGLPGS